MATREIYVSIDVETDGPIPGPHSMLSLGAAAFDLAAADPRTPLAMFEVNLATLDGAFGAPETMAWWATQPDAWAAHRRDIVEPGLAMRRFVTWLADLPGRPVIVGYPVTFDFMFVYWYVMRFGLAPGQACPFGFQGLDIKTFAWTRLGGDFRGASKARMPRAWFEGAPAHDHTALRDAVGQGILFVNLARAPRTPDGLSPDAPSPDAPSPDAPSPAGS